MPKRERKTQDPARQAERRETRTIGVLVSHTHVAIPTGGEVRVQALPTDVAARVREVMERYRR